MPSSEEDGERDDPERDDVAHELYRPAQSRSLSDAVLDAMDACGDADLTESEVVLYDVIDPDALDRLVRRDAPVGPELEFDVADLWVRLWGTDPIHIEVVALPTSVRT